MAAIDKTYTSDYNEYQKFLNWAKETTFTCPNGLKLYVYDYVYDYWTEEDMKETPRPVMNSPQTLDYFLIKYCPFEFVKERMREVYDDEFVNSVLNGTSEYDTFKYPEIGTKFTIVRGRHMKHKDYLWKFRKRKIYFDINVEYKEEHIWFNCKLKRFLLPDELGEIDTSWAECGRTVKSLIRHLRKVKLPKGSIIKTTGRYIGEDLLILVK